MHRGSISSATIFLIPASEYNFEIQIGSKKFENFYNFSPFSASKKSSTMRAP